MSEWTEYRIKDICLSIGSGTTPKSTNEKFYEAGQHYWVNTGDLNNGIVSDSRQKITDLALKECSALHFYPEGTVIEAMYGATIGKVGLLNMKATVNQACCALVINKKIALPKFVLNYLFNYKPLLIKESFGGTQPNVNQTKVATIKIALPSLSEQQRIVDYLDDKTKAIDDRISVLEKKSDAYTRLKASVINRAVTRGLNPNVTLKNSGIEWIGMIPEHWEVKRVKDIGNLKLGKMLTDRPKDGYHLRSYLKSKNIGWNKLKLDSVEKMYFSDTELKDLRLQKNDLIISEGGEVGKTSIWQEELPECYIQNSVHKLTFNKDVCSKYFLYLFYALGYKGFFKSIVNLVSIMHLTYEKLRRLEVQTPSFEEQQSIASYLDNKCSEIDKAINNLGKQIDALKRLKRSLINEVVTGKRKV